LSITLARRSGRIIGLGPLRDCASTCSRIAAARRSISLGESIVPQLIGVDAGIPSSANVFVDFLIGAFFFLEGETGGGTGSDSNKSLREIGREMIGVVSLPGWSPLISESCSSLIQSHALERSLISLYLPRCCVSHREMRP